MLTEPPNSQIKGVQFDVTANRMGLMLRIEQGAAVSSSEIIAAIRAMKVVRFDDGLVIEAIEKRKSEAMSMEVASGVPLVEDRPQRIDYWVPAADGINNLVAKVEAGQVIASISPEIAGTDGTDVFGQPVARTSPPPLQIGRNLKVDKGKIVAETRGNLRLKGNVLSAEPLLEMLGDGGNTAPIQHDGDVVIKSSLIDGHCLQITGSLTVAGAVEAVQIKTGGTVHLQGGIIGKQKGKFTIGGGLRCRFVSGGFIVCGEDIVVQGAVTDSRIACAGRLSVMQGVIFGGALAANGGLTCNSLGHPAGTSTLVEAGAGIASRAFLAAIACQIEANRKRIGTVRAKIEPLLKLLKSLNAQQREKVTELLYEADEMEAATHQLEADLESQTRHFDEKECAEVSVAKVVHPGVTVRFPFAKTVFNVAIKGPFTLVPHKSGGITEIVLVDGQDQSRTVLPTLPVDPIEAAKSVQLMESNAA